ncbi:MAG: prolyl oligopeptidase family serine peptidase [Acidimicrobiales bacterium]|nr:prolyl oligopeptidase family serine peptidase [Acidimicrobiales bacterium]
MVAAALLTSGSVATAERPPQYFVDESLLPFDGIPGIETERVWGVHKGAGYRMEAPADWNGDLVVWAHGFRGTDLELTVDNGPLREHLIANGYAWAASSYARNDYDVATGVQDTHAVTKLFNGKFSKPDRVYLYGASMGGHITGVAIEQYPNLYDGAMPVCGVMGDYELFDYFLDVNVTAQALAGVDSGFPVGADYLTVDVPDIKANLELTQDTFPFALNTNGEAWKSLVEIESGGDRPGFDQGFLFWTFFAGDFLFGLGGGDGTLVRSPGVAVDNADTVYQVDADPSLNQLEQDLNDIVTRVEADRQGRAGKGLAQVPKVDGDITMPVLTLHTLGDLFVPFSMQQAYADRVAANGASDLLVQRAIRDVDHCSFVPAELQEGFDDLVNWVENGVKPGGDDIFATSDPLYGCEYTRFDRPYPAPLAIPACP